MGNTSANGKRNAFGKAIQVLTHMVDDTRDQWGVNDLASSLGLVPSTVHRSLKLLQSEHLVAADPNTGRYHLDLELYRLVGQIQRRFTLPRVARPVVEELVSRCNETAYIGIYDPTRLEMMIALSMESTQPVRYVVPLHQWIPVYSGASGLAIMAFLPREERERIIARTSLVPLTQHTITDPAALEAELARIRSRGYAHSTGQRIPGAVGTAAPIWGPDGRGVGALIVTVPEQRFLPEHAEWFGRLVVEHAASITARLGGHPATDID